MNKILFVFLFLFSSLAYCQTQNEGKIKFFSVDKVMITVEISTPIPKKMLEYKKEKKEINLWRCVSGAGYDWDSINWIESDKFLKSLFTKYKKYKLSSEEVGLDNLDTSGLSAKGKQETRLHGAYRDENIIVFVDGKKEFSIRTLYSDWLKNNAKIKTSANAD